MPIYGPAGVIVCDLLLFECVKFVILWSDLMIVNCFNCARLEVFPMVWLRIAVFWDAMLSCSQCFEERILNLWKWRWHASNHLPSNKVLHPRSIVWSLSEVGSSNYCHLKEKGIYWGGSFQDHLVWSLTLNFTKYCWTLFMNYTFCTHICFNLSVLVSVHSLFIL